LDAPVLNMTARMKFSENATAQPAQSIVRFPNLSRLLGGAFFCASLAVRAANPTSVQLAWNASPDTGVTGYRIYYGVSPAQYTNSIAVGNLTSATVPGLVDGVTYYFATTAYTASGVESSFSNEISYKSAFSQLRARLTSTRQMILTIQGQIGHNYNIETTQDFTTWIVIGTATPGSAGSVDFTDAAAANYSRRFYRLRDTTP